MKTTRGLVSSLVRDRVPAAKSGRRGLARAWVLGAGFLAVPALESGAWAADAACQDPMKYRSSFQFEDSAGTLRWDLEKVIKLVDEHYPPGVPETCRILVGEVAKREHGKYLENLAKSCKSGTASEARLLECTALPTERALLKSSAWFSTDLSDALAEAEEEAIPKYGTLPSLKASGDHTIIGCAGASKWCRQVAKKTEADFVSKARSYATASRQLFSADARAKADAERTMHVQGTNGMVCARVPAGFEGVMELAQDTGEVTKLPAFCGNQAIDARVRGMGYQYAQMSGWGASQWLGKKDWWRDVGLGVASMADSWTPDAVTDVVTGGRTIFDGKDKMSHGEVRSLFAAYQSYLLSRLWLGMSESQRGDALKEDACAANPQAMALKGQKGVEQLSPDDAALVEKTFVDVCSLDPDKPQAFYKYMGPKDLADFLEVSEKSGGADAAALGAKLCIYYDLLDNGTETIHNTVSMGIGLIGGVAASAALTAGVAAAAPSFGTTAAGGFAIAFAAGETAEVAVAIHEVAYRCGEYAKVRDTSWLEVLDDASFGSCETPKKTGLLVGQDQVQSLCKECETGVKIAGIGFALGSVINVATGGVGTYATAVKTQMAKELVRAMSLEGGEEAVTRLLKEWALNGTWTQKMAVRFLKGDNAVVGKLGFNLEGAMKTFEEQLKKAGLGDEAIEAATGSLKRLVQIARAGGKDIPAASDAEVAMIQKGAAAFRAEAVQRETARLAARGGTGLRATARSLVARADAALDAKGAQMVREGIRNVDQGVKSLDQVGQRVAGSLDRQAADVSAEAATRAAKAGEQAGGKTIAEGAGRAVADAPGEGAQGAAAREGAGGPGRISEEDAVVVLEREAAQAEEGVALRNVNVARSKDTGQAYLLARKPNGRITSIKAGEGFTLDGQPVKLTGKMKVSKEPKTLGRTMVEVETHQVGGAPRAGSSPVVKSWMNLDEIAKSADHSIGTGYERALAQTKAQAAREAAASGGMRVAGGEVFAATPDGSVVRMATGDQVTLRGPAGGARAAQVTGTVEDITTRVGRGSRAPSTTVAKIRTADGALKEVELQEPSQIVSGGREYAGIRGGPAPRVAPVAKEVEERITEHMGETRRLLGDGSEEQVLFDNVAQLKYQRNLAELEGKGLSPDDKIAKAWARTKDEMREIATSCGIAK